MTRLLLLFVLSFLSFAQSSIPHLQKQGTATQLIVDGRPLLILGGELHNSSSSSLEYMRPIWKRMLDMNFNTVLAGVSWELVEPEQGHFDFQLVDGLIDGARRNNLKLVFLWFGSWKNGMSSYMPLWVKKDYKRFPRVVIGDGKTIEVLSTLSSANQEADAKAFAALMRHIRDVDSKDNTVVMMQVENEVGVLGDSRDRSTAANRAFAQPVPKVLLKDGAKGGSWEEVFGRGPKTDEMFMAWNYAIYVDKVAAAGKAEYPIPMFVNTWLSNPSGKPGDWPSGGPLPAVVAMWRAGAPHLDLLTPDIYQPNFADWCRDYTQGGHALFIPEMRGDATGARSVFYAIGQHDGIGTSPFAVDSIADPEKTPLGRSYAILSQMAPVILAHQGKGQTAGFLLDKEHPSAKARMGDYELDIRLDSIFGYTASTGYGLIVQTGPEEFVGAGSGFQVEFRPATTGPKLAGVGLVEEGSYSNGTWIPGRRLNGDEDDQGKHWRMSERELGILRCVVYRYE